MKVTYTPSGTCMGVPRAIRVELARHQMSATKLAEHANLTQAYLSRRMAGVVPFSVRDLDLIAQVLGTTIAAIIAEAEREGQKQDEAAA